ncbi:MAG: hypothetical protein F4087_09645 [Gemmatimonadetes bacterium]|nr:hypothetical protein [Gemmatimonadota bacterium]MYE69181.1 hypothetical protein [Gemmatimonadota bacterium]MYJ68755.1 hypothetical protein [Gemmatimonadota bacterium]
MFHGDPPFVRLGGWAWECGEHRPYADRMENRNRTGDGSATVSCPDMEPPMIAAPTNEVTELLQRVDDARRARQGEYERFLTDLTPLLSEAGIAERRRDRHLAHRFNVFRYLSQDELGLSRIIADLLDPTAEHGQGASFLEAMLDALPETRGRFGTLDRTAAATGAIRVRTERRTTTGRFIDITVDIPEEGGRFCLAFEASPASSTSTWPTIRATCVPRWRCMTLGGFFGRTCASGSSNACASRWRVGCARNRSAPIPTCASGAVTMGGRSTQTSCGSLPASGAGTKTRRPTRTAVARSSSSPGNEAQTAGTGASAARRPRAG